MLRLLSFVAFRWIGHLLRQASSLVTITLVYNLETVNLLYKSTAKIPLEVEAFGVWRSQEDV